MEIRRLLDFLKTAEQLKCNTRHSYTSSGRLESVAEHSWRLALMAMLVGDEFLELDMDKVIKMCLIHDIVEIDAGDTYAYDSEGAKTKRARELKAADRILGILPEDQGSYFRKLWDEFEEYESADAKFAHLLDNFQPFLLNDASNGLSWTEHGVHKSQVCKRNEKVPETSEIVWNKMLEVMDKHIAEGHLKAD